VKHVAFPFLTLDETQVHASAWSLLEEDGSTTALGDHVAGWDYARDLRISRRLGLAEGLTGHTLGLSGEDLELEAVVRLGTGPGSLPRRSWIIAQTRLRPGGKSLLDHVVAGHRLSQRLWLQTTILLPRNIPGESRFAPQREGSVLWRDEIDIGLEGDSPRFPMEIVSFRERFAGRPESGSLWHLHWRPGHLHRDFGGSVRLFLNHDRQDFIERFVASDPLMLQCTLADVMTQILDHALRDEDLEEHLADCEPTSVAGHIATWLAIAFPGQDPASIRNMLLTSPGHFRSAILAMADPAMLGVPE